MFLAVLTPRASGASVAEQYSYTTGPLPLAPEDGTGAPGSDTRSIPSFITQLSRIHEVVISRGAGERGEKGWPRTFRRRQPLTLR